MALTAEPVPASPEVLEMRPGLSVEEVQARLAGASRREDTGQRVLAFYLVEMEVRQLFQSSGHGSTVHYAASRLELDRRRVAELLRVGRKLLELREVDRAFCEGRLGWAKVLIVARMAVPEHEAAWLERALALDVHALRLLATRSKEGGAPRRAGDEKGLPEIRFPVAGSLDALMHAQLDAAQRRLGAELGREVDFVQTLKVLLDEFHATPADGTAPGRKRVDASAFRVVLTEVERGGPLYVQTEDGLVPIDSGDSTGLQSTALSECVRCDAGVRNEDGHDHRARDVKTPPAMRRRVLRRDGHRCRSCRSRWSLMVHHIEFRSHGGRTLPQNLITVCERCHGLVHANLLLIEGTSAEGARFLDAARRPLTEVKPSAPIEPPPPAPSPAPVPEPTRVTLASIPEEVDATWWRRHAHLIRDRQGRLCFEPGVPDEAAGRRAAPPGIPAATFQGFLGQDGLVARLQCEVQASRLLGEPIPHVLLTGPAGTGKTSLARGIAAEAGRPLVEVSAPNVGDRTDWIRTIAGLPEGSVLFVDEVHALSRTMLDVLLQALSERRLTLTLSDGVIPRQITLRLPEFTLVAATNEEGAIPPALHSRFGLRETLAHYEEDVLAQVVRAAAVPLGTVVTEDGALRIARAARGTPRGALRLLRRARAYLVVHGGTILDAATMERVLASLGYDADDLTLGEQRYLAVLRASPGAIPLARFARMLGTIPQTLVEHVEPRLFKLGLVRTTSRGRMAMPYARRPVADATQADDGAPNVRQTSPAALSGS